LLVFGHSSFVGEEKIMKRIFLSTALLALSVSAALAADLPYRKEPPVLPPPPPPLPLWTGFYAGMNAGYGFGTSNNNQSIGVATLPFTGNTYDRYHYPYSTDFGGVTSLGAGLALSGVGGGNNANQNGFIGGGQVGYNYQWGQRFVIGLEADMQGTGIRGTSHTVGLGGDSALLYQDLRSNGNPYYTDTLNSQAWGATRVNAGVDWLGTVRGRLGYLFTPTLLLYATGGLTYGGVYANVNNFATSSTNVGYAYYNSSGAVTSSGTYSNSYNHTFIGGGNKSSVLVGWNVGGGLEWMFMPNWSLKAEGIYWNMGNMTVPTVAFAAAPVSFSGSSSSNWYNNGASAIGATRVNYQGVIARVGVNYHFNWGNSAPVVAQY
jgi:outer membrane immunogenic protein